jgi:queuine tRNA-ribosyltransferase
MKPLFFRSLQHKLPLPVFFPDATRAVIRTLDSVDIKQTKTPGILVNTYHLYKELGKNVLKTHGGVRPFMNWQGGIISDSGGFQVMSLIKKIGGNGKITDKGVTFQESKKKRVSLTPEQSIAFQMLLKPDMVVVLDDFTAPKSSRKQAEETVERTLVWAQRSKDEFEKQCKKENLKGKLKPYLLGVVQGGDFLDLRKYCTEKLVEIGFDGLGYGGWPIKDDKTFNYDVARVIRKYAPDEYFLYGLGIGKPHEIVELVDSGWHIFDCVLPTRDARHKRLYVYTADSIDSIDVHTEKFYSYYTPDKEKYYNDSRPVSTACDCLLCTNYSRSYLAHLFRIGDSTALRLATIHNLRFYSLLMEKLKKE